jgi:trans-aconitate methyltransferase
VNAPDRARNTIFGEVARLYHDARPTYPDALFDAVVAYGALQPRARVLEIGAGTGKATVEWLRRGLDVVALEPSPGMAAVLAETGVDAEATTFEAWTVQPEAFRLVTAAQAWHWVTGPDRYDRAVAALAPGGVLALFWNKPREFDGALGADVETAYQQYAPELAEDVAKNWPLRHTANEMAATDGLDDTEQRDFVWTQRYTTDEYVKLLGTHSNHRMLGDERRDGLHHAVREVLDAHGGTVEVVYDVELYLARRA